MWSVDLKTNKQNPQQGPAEASHTVRGRRSRSSSWSVHSLRTIYLHQLYWILGKYNCSKTFTHFRNFSENPADQTDAVDVQTPRFSGWFIQLLLRLLEETPAPLPGGAAPDPQGQHYRVCGEKGTPHPSRFCSTGGNELQLNARGHGNRTI